MNIHIRSHEEASRFLAENPGQYDVILISAEPIMAMKERIQINACEVLCLYFQDAVAPQPDVRLPTTEHVSQALSWAEGRANIIVACAAGISRSSAIAYLLWCRLMPPEAAVRNLDQHRHMPNELVVRLGAELLANPLIFSAFTAWRERTEQLWLVKAMLDLQPKGTAQS
jgi:predicted protein tyrosine phosphatase